MVNFTVIDFGDGNPRTDMEDFNLRTGKDPIRVDPTFSHLIELFIFSLAVYGTIVWGYGDLFY